MVDRRIQFLGYCIYVSKGHQSWLKGWSFCSSKWSIMMHFSTTSTNVFFIRVTYENVRHIMLFRCITMFCGTDNIMQNIGCGEYFCIYCQSHKTSLWILTMLWNLRFRRKNIVSHKGCSAKVWRICNQGNYRSYCHEVRSLYLLI